jgi:metal-responsive CopG/Arc/MetJ family transcriptional regulator
VSMPERVNIEIPKKLYDKLEKKAKDSMFQNVSELSEFVLTQFLEIEESRSPTSLPEKDEMEMRERLRRLGYE